MDGGVPRDAVAQPNQTDQTAAPDQNTLVVLGGGIGAGKSAVGELLADHGFTVIVADRIGHDVLVDDPDVLAAVADRWPEVVVDGAVDRGRLASVVFADPASLAELEAMTHPRILDRVRTAIAEAPGDVVVEIPLLPLARTASGLLDGRVVRLAVVADVPTRIARAVARGGDPEDVSARISVQASDAEWRSWADLVIDNGGSWSATEAAVRAVIEDVRIHV